MLVRQIAVVELDAQEAPVRERQQHVRRDSLVDDLLREAVRFRKLLVVGRRQLVEREDGESREPRAIMLLKRRRLPTGRHLAHENVDVSAGAHCRIRFAIRVSAVCRRTIRRGHVRHITLDGPRRQRVERSVGAAQRVLVDAAVRGHEVHQRGDQVPLLDRRFVLHQLAGQLARQLAHRHSRRRRRRRTLGKLAKRARCRQISECRHRRFAQALRQGDDGLGHTEEASSVDLVEVEHVKADQGTHVGASVASASCHWCHRRGNRVRCRLDGVALGLQRFDLGLSCGDFCVACGDFCVACGDFCVACGAFCGDFCVACGELRQKVGDL